MNTVSRPCEPSPDYVYYKCLEEKISQKIGCKPYWIKLDSNLETCKELKNIENYLLKLRESIGMDEQTIYEAYNCLKPCTYIEYKVREQNDIYIAL